MESLARLRTCIESRASWEPRLPIFREKPTIPKRMPRRSQSSIREREISSTTFR